MTSAEEDLMAMALRTKPHNNVWLYLSLRLCTLVEDAFEHAPAVIKEIHVYLKNLFDARDRFGCHDADRSVGSDSRTAGIRQGVVWTDDVFRVSGRASQGIQEFCVECQPGLSRGLFRAELGRAEGVEGAGQRR